MSNTSHISGLLREFHQNRWEKFNSEKVCEIAYARIQGLVQLIDHFKNSSLLTEDEKVRPVVLLDGVLQPFPVGVHIRVVRNSAGETLVTAYAQCIFFYSRIYLF